MSPPQPELPVTAYDDSMLCRKFGPEIANYFSATPLNRASFLRPSQAFLSAAVTSPSARFSLVDDLAPLAKDPSDLAFVTHKEIKHIIGENPFSKSEAEVIAEYDSSVPQPPLVLFLGLDESKPNAFSHNEYKGTPYFAVDITPRGENAEAEKKKSLIYKFKTDGHIFLPGRAAMTLNAQHAAIFAQARSYIDWNTRSPFCAGCGQPTISVHAGAKRVCPPTDFALAKTENPSTPQTELGAVFPPRSTAPDRLPCATRHGVSNLCFPRTDPTVIMAILSPNSKKVLLGRQASWPKYFYSALAGFLEPGESVEDAVRREVYEESGVKVGRVVIQGTQPWPYPASLMIGCVGQAIEGGEKINLRDEELEAAKWINIEDLRKSLLTGTSGLDGPPGEGYKEGDMRLPPKTAIAHQLMKAVVDGWMGPDVKL